MRADVVKPTFRALRVPDGDRDAEDGGLVNHTRVDGSGDRTLKVPSKQPMTEAVAGGRFLFRLRPRTACMGV